MNALREFTAPPKTDWFRILLDLQNAGLCNAEVARRLNIPRETLRGWKNGHQPVHHQGDALLAFHAWVMAK